MAANNASCNCPTTCWTNLGAPAVPSEQLVSWRCKHRQTGLIEPKLVERLSNPDSGSSLLPKLQLGTRSKISLAQASDGVSSLNVNWATGCCPIGSGLPHLRRQT